jgi:hypothetical protein
MLRDSVTRIVYEFVSMSVNEIFYNSYTVEAR